MKNYRGVSESTWRLSLVCLCLILVSCAGTGSYAVKNEPKPEHSSAPNFQIQPVKPQPQIDKLIPGLAVRYIEKKFRHINEMPAEINAYAVGKPILMLNHRFSGEEPVFDSGMAREVGLWITGWIRFSKTGQYDLMSRSNDGIRVWIGENQIIDDPEVHSDRFSPKASLTVTEAGYYPLKILYFQRKGTACIEMHWKMPGEMQFSIIPETAYSHLPPAENK
jgi:hypothetical protein